MVAGLGKASDNEEMVLLEAAVVVGILSVIVYGTIWLLMRPKGPRRPVMPAGQWQAAHYDVKGETHVVLQKVSPGGVNVLDEHVIATIPVGDPDYDAKFLAAMTTARERRALFEVEEDY